VSALPLRPFGLPDLVWPPGVCEACYEPQWSDALHDWEFVEGAARPCSACQVLQMTLERSLAPHRRANDRSSGQKSARLDLTGG
jgi:hypothetical protein